MDTAAIGLAKTPRPQRRKEIQGSHVGRYGASLGTRLRPAVAEIVRTKTQRTQRHKEIQKLFFASLRLCVLACLFNELPAGSRTPQTGAAVPAVFPANETRALSSRPQTSGKEALEK
jgi:hypothetical protein